MVFTIEPGIYIPANAMGVELKWWNIGVRIEDVVLVTENGYECLSCSTPREIDEVEKTVQSGAPSGIGGQVGLGDRPRFAEMTRKQGIGGQTPVQLN
jgi:hypothetical protein